MSLWPFPTLAPTPTFLGDLSADIQVDPAAKDELVAAADSILAGSWPVFQRVWDTNALDWFTDPKTGTRAPQEKYAFSDRPP